MPQKRRRHGESEEKEAAKGAEAPKAKQAAAEAKEAAAEAKEAEAANVVLRLIDKVLDDTKSN